jgi:hypothetical protein
VMGHRCSAVSTSNELLLQEDDLISCAVSKRGASAGLRYRVLLPAENCAR